MPDAHVQLTRFNERFQVRAQTGAGGMATVYRATDILTGEDVALKLLHDSATSSPERFNQEATLLAELAHPAIVRYVDHGVTPTGERYLAMEWLEGETLEERLAAGPLGILNSLRLARRVLEGLAVAHRKGIVHRDIKPANLFLRDKELSQIKLLDFGIARRTGDTRRITLTGSSLGTPAYMSPEQVRGIRSLDARADIFSLGSVLYECITGETAFAGETPLAVMAKICLEDSVDVHARHPDLPPQVAALLTRMLAKDPDKRPATAAELATEIGALINHLVTDGHVTGERGPLRSERVATPHLATAEQRVVCAILIARPPSADESRRDLPAGGTWDVPGGSSRLNLTDAFDESTFIRIREAVAPFGARVDVFLGTALAVTLVGEGTPTDHAAEAARCALTLKAILPRACFAVGTGRVVVGEEALGELVAATARLLGSEEEPGAVRLDEVTAGLLESRFEIRAHGARAADERPGAGGTVVGAGTGDGPRGPQPQSRDVSAEPPPRAQVAPLAGGPAAAASVTIAGAGTGNGARGPQLRSPDVSAEASPVAQMAPPLGEPVAVGGGAPAVGSGAAPVGDGATAVGTGALAAAGGGPAVTAPAEEAGAPRMGTTARYHLLFEKGLKEGPRTVLGREVPCVGRDREIGNLLALWDESSGEPVARAVVVTAAAGAGKSRVRHEFLERLQSRGERFQYLIGRGDSVRSGAPFAVLGPALRAAAGLAGGEPPPVQQKRLLAHVSRHVPAAQARRVAAFIGEIAGVPFPDDDLPQLRAARQDPRLMADQTLGAWLDYIEAECNAHPVLIIFEDLHWGDMPSVQLVDAALRTLRERPLMVLALARPEVDDKFPGLWDDRDVQRVSLAPLTPKSAQKLIQHIVADVPPDQAAWIVERADGNPFYLEELVRAVGDGTAARGQPVPDTVIGMVQARFDALGPDAKRVLRAAAIFGHTFKAKGVLALIGDEDRTLARWLDILHKKEIIFPRQPQVMTEFVFRHALLEEAAYAMLAPEDLVLGHRLAGEFLEDEGERAAIVLVDHFEKGADHARAAHWCRFAAEQALEANDLAGVIERVERGVRLGAKGEDLTAIRMSEAQARFWRGEYAEAERASREAMASPIPDVRLDAIRELISALGQQAKFDEVEFWTARVVDVHAERGSSSARIRCLIHAAGQLVPAGRARLAEQIADSVARHSELQPAVAARLLEVRGRLAIGGGYQAAALRWFEASMQAYENAGDLRNATATLANIGFTLCDLGAFEEGQERLERALAHAERLDLRFVAVAGWLNLALVYAFAGRLDAAASAAARVRESATRQGDLRILGGICCYSSLIEHLRGNHESAEIYALSAIEALKQVPALLPAGHAALSRALLARGQVNDALAEAERANALMAAQDALEDGESLIRLMVVRCRLAAGDIAGALAALDEAWRRLQTRASLIDDLALREKFLRRIPDHRATLELVENLLSNVSAIPETTT